MAGGGVDRLERDPFGEGAFELADPNTGAFVFEPSGGDILPGAHINAAMERNRHLRMMPPDLRRHYRGAPETLDGRVTWSDVLPKSLENVAQATGAGAGQVLDFVSGGTFGDYAAGKQGVSPDEWRVGMSQMRTQDPAATIVSDALTLPMLAGPLGKVAQGAFSVARAAPKATALGVMSASATEAGEPSAFEVQRAQAAERVGRLREELARIDKELGASKSAGGTQGLPERFNLEINVEALKPESKNYVEQIQAGLAMRGYYDGAIDGKPGSRTRSAVQAYLKDRQTALDDMSSKASSDPAMAALQKRRADLTARIAQEDELLRTAETKLAADLRQKEIDDASFYESIYPIIGLGAGAALGMVKPVLGVSHFNHNIAKKADLFNKAADSIPVDSAGSVVATDPGLLRGSVNAAYAGIGRPTPFAMDAAGQPYKRGVFGRIADATVGSKDPTKFRSSIGDLAGLYATDAVSVGVPLAMMQYSYGLKTRAEADIKRIEGLLADPSLPDSSREDYQKQLAVARQNVRTANILGNVELGLLAGYPVGRGMLAGRKNMESYIDPAANAKIQQARGAVEKIDRDDMRSARKSQRQSELQLRRYEQERRQADLEFELDLKRRQAEFDQDIARRPQELEFDFAQRQRDADFAAAQREIELDRLRRAAKRRTERTASDGRAQGTPQGGTDQAGRQGGESGRQVEGPGKDTRYSPAVSDAVRRDAGIVADQGKFSLYLTDDAMEVIEGMGKRVPRDRVNAYLDHTRAYIRRIKTENPDVVIDAEFIRKMPKIDPVTKRRLITGAAVAGTGAAAATSLYSEKANAQPRDAQGNFRPMTNREKQAFERKLKRLRGELEGRD